MFGAVVAGTAGLLMAAAAHFLGLMVSGGGHAWTEPFFFSVAMWLAFPWMFIRIHEHRAGSDEFAWLDWLVLFCGLLLDAWLVVATVGSSDTTQLSGTGTERFLQLVEMDPARLSCGSLYGCPGKSPP